LRQKCDSKELKPGRIAATWFVARWHTWTRWQSIASRQP